MKRSAIVLGWSMVIVSCLMIVIEFVSILTSGSAEELAALLNQMPSGGSTASGIVFDTLRYDRAWSVYTIVYFSIVLAGAILFLNRKPVGKLLLRIACWVGIANAFVDSVVSMVLWNEMEKALTSLVGPMSVRFMSWNPFGLVLIIIGFFLWVIPAIGLLFYLRRLDVPSMPPEPAVFMERKPAP